LRVSNPPYRRGQRPQGTGETHGRSEERAPARARIDQAIREIVMGVFARAYRILETNRAVLERCARELLVRETLDENDIRQLTQGLQREAAETTVSAAG
ncbi:MAG: hypothetical protein ACSLE1_03425, partial [Sphingobium sp.]